MFKRVILRPKRFRLTRGPLWRGVTAGVAAAAVGTIACRRVASPADVALLPATRADGQWVWNTADLALWRRARATHPALRPGVWVSTVWWEGGATGGVQQRLALSPRPAAGAPLAIVVRFDDRMHAAWLAAPDSVIAARLDARLDTLLRLVAATGADAHEVQLDYDCPVRRLARWAAVVRRLHAGALAGREVWVTSLVAHVAQREYGDHFRGVVSGHIVQLFDTGDEPSRAATAHLAAQLDRAALPYRVGLGAFERVLRSPDRRTRLTRHRAWFALAPALARSPWYRGLWVFPGGQPWTTLVVSPSPAPASDR